MSTVIGSNSSHIKSHISCEECGLISETVALPSGTKACCPRCGHTLQQRFSATLQQVLACSFACLVAFGLSLSFPFMSFNAGGLSKEIHLFEAAMSMFHYDYDFLSIVIILCVFILPVLYISIVVVLHVLAYHLDKHRRLGKPTPHLPLGLLRGLTNFTAQSKPWLMIDVFLTGVLVALVKIMSLAQVGFGMSFWAFCLYTVLFVKLMSIVDEYNLWEAFIPRLSVPLPEQLQLHDNHDYGKCHICSQITHIREGQPAHCCRCKAKLKSFNPSKSNQYAVCFLISAVMFYIPANLYPIMYTTSVGSTTASTIMSGVALLWSYKSYPVAMIIFCASVVIPMAKIIALSIIYWHAAKKNLHSEMEALKQLKLYRITEFIGRWSMIDIFVVALLAALVQLDRIMAIEPGPAGICFALVVLLTMISAHLFDPRALWHSAEIKPIPSDENNSTMKSLPSFQPVTGKPL